MDDANSLVPYAPLTLLMFTRIEPVPVRIRRNRGRPQGAATAWIVTSFGPLGNLRPESEADRAVRIIAPVKQSVRARPPPKAGTATAVRAPQGARYGCAAGKAWGGGSSTGFRGVSRPHHRNWGRARSVRSLSGRAGLGQHLTEPDREKRTFLLWLTEYFRAQLERTLDVLGIEVPEYM
jgi:hypothetical protein